MVVALGMARQNARDDGANGPGLTANASGGRRGEKSISFEPVGDARDGSTVFPVGDGGDAVAVEVAEFADLGYEVGAFLIPPAVFA